MINMLQMNRIIIPMIILLYIIHTTAGVGFWSNSVIPGRWKRQDNSFNGCILPAHLRNGKYSYPLGGDYIENKYTDISTSITITCDDGYKLSGKSIFLCWNKVWLPSLSDSFCKPLYESLRSSDTYNIECYFNNQSVSCENPQEGTIGKASCKPFYVTNFIRAHVYQSGSWNSYPAPCEPECGRKRIYTNIRRKRVIGGSDALQNEFPWMVAIYNTSIDQNKLICGATLISSSYVVTAATCVTGGGFVPYPKEYFTIVAGKHNNDLNIRDNSMQAREIKRVFVHEDYRGRYQNYRDDIALIEVEKFEMTIGVQPICVDWNNQFEELDFKENNTGVTVGWGFTEYSSRPAKVLKKLSVPFISKKTCRENLDPEFTQKYYTSDKFCAGFKDKGTGVCSGDSGSGLYFKSTPMAYYLRGIVSLSRRDNAGCDVNTYALYTRISRYLTWLQSIMET